MADGPAVVNQQQINSGKTCCPFAAQKPCDPDLLKVKVEFIDRPAKGESEGKASVRELETNVIKRKPLKTARVGRNYQIVRNYPKLGDRANELLARYDFVIEAFADFPQTREVEAKAFKAAMKELVSGDGKKFAKNKAKITANAKFYGLHCEPQIHGKLVMKALSGKDKAVPEMTSVKVDQAENALVPQEFAAVRFPLLDDMWAAVDPDGAPEGEGGVGAMFIFDFIGSIFAALYPKEIEIVAEGCGKRPKEAPKPLNHDLRGLVRIFRKDVWTVGIKIPALSEFKRERKTTRELVTGDVERSVSQEGRFGHNSNKSSTAVTTRDNGVIERKVEREQLGREQGSSFSQTSTTYGAIKKIESESKYTDRDGSKTHGYMKEGAVYGTKTHRELVTERLKNATGFDISVSRNGAELPLKATFEKIKTSVEMFATTIAKIEELFKKAPQIGWKATFEISALAGSIVLEFGPRTEALTADGRYYPINYICEGKLEIELINLKLGLSFGLEAMVLDSGLVLKVEGSVSVLVKIDLELSLNMLTNPVKEIGLEAKSTNELKIVGYVSLMGKTLAGAELSIANGFEFKDGKITVDVVKPQFALTGTLRAKPVTVSGWIKVPWWWDKKVENVVLLDGCDIHTFK